MTFPTKAIEEIQEIQRYIFSLMIQEALGENYGGTPVGVNVYFALKRLKTVDAQAWMYLYLKTREDWDLRWAAEFWKEKNRRAYLRARAHTKIVGAFLMLKHYFSVYIWYMET